jgi:hypothetical protein
MMAHPDFIHAPETRRFQGASLVSLWATLKRELEGKAAGGQVYRILPSGACVALWREGPSGLLVLRLSRRERFTTPAGPGKWQQEIDTFCKHFGIADWVRVDDVSAPGVAVLLYEPAVLL